MDSRDAGIMDYPTVIADENGDGDEGIGISR